MTSFPITPAMTYLYDRMRSSGMGAAQVPAGSALAKPTTLDAGPQIRPAAAPSITSSTPSVGSAPVDSAAAPTSSGASPLSAPATSGAPEVQAAEGGKKKKKKCCKKGKKKCKEKIDQQMQQVQPSPAAPGQSPQSPMQRVEQRLDQMGQLTPAMKDLLCQCAQAMKGGPSMTMDMMRMNMNMGGMPPSPYTAAMGQFPAMGALPGMGAMQVPSMPMPTAPTAALPAATPAVPAAVAPAVPLISRAPVNPSLLTATPRVVREVDDRLTRGLLA